MPVNEELKNLKKHSRTNFRGFIQSKDSYYYILNELVSGESTKVFSAVKILENTREKIDNQRYCVRYISKDWIKLEILSKIQIPEERINKFFYSLRKKYEGFRKIVNHNIQELKDYIEDEDSIYIVFEYCDYTLKDYLQILREPIKFTRYPFEVKVRKLISQILETLYHMQSEMVSMCFGGMLNSSDIMVSELVDSSIDKSSNSFLVKFPHPFLLDLFTISKIYNTEKFPSFYAPEIFNLFESQEITKVIEKKDSFDLNSLVSKINQNMDMWSLGYLLYEILFEDTPFEFDDLSSAVKSFNNNFYYNIFPKRISKVVLEIITRCLQIDPQDRLKTDILYELKNEIKNENENLEDFERHLRDKSNDKRDYDQVVEFYLTNYNDYERY